MSFPRYPAYKDSGVEWLGKVPEHWLVDRLKYACKVFPSNVDKKSYENETPVRLCNYTNVYYNETIVSDMDFMAATATSEQIEKFTLRAGDTIITKDSETADDIAIASYVPEDLPGTICGYHLSMVRPNEATHGAFVKRLFDSHYARGKFNVLANGLTRVGLGQYALDNVDFPWPPLTEQQAIASFLDRETAKVDALVTEQEKLVALLKEKRQSVISHAVTQGLDPSVPMKDSGVEWLGNVPRHWAVSPLRWLLSTPVTNGVFKKKDDFGKGVLLVNVFDIYRDDYRINYASLDKVDCTLDEQRTYEVSEGDLFFVRSSLKREGVAAVAVADQIDELVVFECHLIRARPNSSRLQGRFASYVLNSAAYRARLVSLAKVTTMTTIDQEAVKSVEIVCPPITEQHEIAQYLDDATKSFDLMTSEAQSAIALLQERRTALISAAVTGQIDVRHLATA